MNIQPRKGTALDRKTDPVAHFTGLGVAFGTAFGAAFGDVAGGLVMGLIIGAAWGAARKRHDTRALEERDADARRELDSGIGSDPG